MLLHDLDRSNGLCNGTQLLEERCSPRVIEATMMTIDHKGHRDVGYFRNMMNMR